MPLSELRSLLLKLHAQVTISPMAIEIVLDRAKLLTRLGIAPQSSDEGQLMLSTPATLIRCGIGKPMAIAPTEAAVPALVDPTLVKLLVRAEQAHRALINDAASVDRLQRNELARYARLWTLAPDIISAIVEGHQPRKLSARKLLRTPNLPICWSEQRRTLGFG